MHFSVYLRLVLHHFSVTLRQGVVSDLQWAPDSKQTRATGVRYKHRPATHARTVGALHPLVPFTYRYETDRGCLLWRPHAPSYARAQLLVCVFVFACMYECICSTIRAVRCPFSGIIRVPRITTCLGVALVVQLQLVVRSCHRKKS